VKKIVIYTDGGSRGNPGPAAAGFIFCNEKGEVFKKYSQYLGENITNNEAEYRAVILSLEKFRQVFGKKLAKVTEIEVRSDSELLIRQVCGRYKISEPKIKILFIDVWNLKLDFKNVKFTLIPREKNKEADFLVNEALDGKASAKALF